MEKKQMGDGRRGRLRVFFGFAAGSPLKKFFISKCF